MRAFFSTNGFSSRLCASIPSRSFWALLAAALTFPAAGHADEFVFGPGDKVAVSVHNRPDLSGEFRVQPAGLLSLPFIDGIAVEGRTVAEAHDAIVARLRDVAFLRDPRVSIDIVEPRPVSIMGDIRRPGSYPFQLGMTVRHAVSSAGGTRIVDLETFGAYAEIGAMRERLRTSLEGVGLAMVRQSRLLAERDGAVKFALPESLDQYLSQDRARETAAAETSLLQQRDASYNGQIASLARQTSIYEEEIQALTDQDAAKVREGELLQKELDYVTEIVDKGMAARGTRLIELQRAAVQVEGERRQIAASIAKSKQEIARIEQTRLVLQSQRSVEITTLLKETDDGMSTLRTAIEELQRTLRGAGELRIEPGAPISASASQSGYIIHRSRNGVTKTVAATADSPLLPGDLIEVAAQ